MARCTSCETHNGECRKCDGTGELDGFLGPKRCDQCGGDGRCSSCDGKGYTPGW